jgi:hypothetical protein
MQRGQARSFQPIELPLGSFALTTALDDRVRKSCAASPRSTGVLAHPIFAFVAGLGGMGLPIAEAIERCGGSIDSGPVLAGCEIAIDKPLEVDRTYDVASRIAEYVRKPSRRYGAADHLLLRFELAAQGERFAELVLRIIVPVRAP